MVKVTELGYLGFTITDAAAWREYAADIVGWEVWDDGEEDRFYLRMDNWHHRLTMHIGDEDDLAYIGWRVSGPRELEGMAQQLKDAGVEFQVASDEEAEERHVLGLLKMIDPGGNPTEIFYAPHVETQLPLHPGRRMYEGFVTGDEGLGHVIIREEDMEAAVAFYELIGLIGAPEYKLKLPNGMIAKPQFMHCNNRQHTVAFGLGPQEKRINHLMIEYQSLDDLGKAHDLVRGADIDVAMQLGKHSNDQALTFYSATPSGWLLELGWGARKSLSQQEYYTGDIFGHGSEAKGYGMDIEL